MIFGILLCFILLGGVFYFLMGKTPINAKVQQKVALDFTPDLPPPNPPLFITEETKGLKWLNMIIGTFVLEHFRSQAFTERFVERLNEKMKHVVRPGFIGEIWIENLNFGENVILVDDQIVMQTPACEGELRATSSLRYGGSKPASVLLRVEVLMNWPTENFMKIPVALNVFIEQLSGPFLFVMPPGPDPILSLGFTTVPQTKFSVRSEVGNVTLLKNLPKVEQFVLSKLKTFLSRELMVPNGVSVHIPIKGDRPLGFKLLRKVPNNPLLYGQTEFQEPPKDDKKTVAVKEEKKVISVKDEKKTVSVKEEKKVISIKDEKDHSLSSSGNPKFHSSTNSSEIQ